MERDIAIAAMTSWKKKSGLIHKWRWIGHPWLLLGISAMVKMGKC